MIGCLRFKQYGLFTLDAMLQSQNNGQDQERQDSSELNHAQSILLIPKIVSGFAKCAVHIMQILRNDFEELSLALDLANP